MGVPLNHLHSNPYPNTASPGQPRECEAGNEHYESTVGVTTIGNTPRDDGIKTAGQTEETAGGRKVMGRLPERDTRAGATNSRFKWRPSNAMIAVIFILIFTVGPYLAFTGHVPFTSYGYQLKATFSNGVNIATNSPVRIAGVDVGRVISTERDGDATTVTFTVEGKGRRSTTTPSPRSGRGSSSRATSSSTSRPAAPARRSWAATTRSRSATPRPGSRSTKSSPPCRRRCAPTSATCSRATARRSPTSRPRPKTPPSCPRCRARAAPKALNGAFHYGGDAGQYSAQVTNALLGTQPHDLSRLVAGTGRTFAALARNEEDLKGLIVNFDVFTGALAAQSANLSTTVHRLAPTLKNFHSSLVSLNQALPPLRAWAIEMNPAVAELPDWIKAGKPWLAQARPLLSGREARRHGEAAARSDARASPAPHRRARRWRCRSSTGSASARARSSYPPATR